MIKLIISAKGTGKTKNLIDLVNSAAGSSNGSVICIEKGDKLNYDVTYKARLIDTKSFSIDDGRALYGFVAGIAASNHDITHVFIDSALKICSNDMAAFEEFVLAADKLGEAYKFECVMTSSIPTEECPESLKKYL